MNYQHVMVDIETTGTYRDRAAMIQLAAAKFDLATGGVDPNTFNRCLWIPKWRTWFEDTRSWWLSDPDRREILDKIYSRMEDPVDVLKDFYAWLPEDNYYIWGKNVSFDFGFLESYAKDYSFPPLNFRNVENIGTWIRARYFPEPPLEADIPFRGAAHDAIFDVFHQIATVLWHARQTGIIHAAQD